MVKQQTIGPLDVDLDKYTPMLSPGKRSPNRSPHRTGDNFKTDDSHWGQGVDSSSKQKPNEGMSNFNQIVAAYNQPPNQIVSTQTRIQRQKSLAVRQGDNIKNLTINDLNPNDHKQVSEYASRLLNLKEKLQFFDKIALMKKEKDE